MKPTQIYILLLPVILQLARVNSEEGFNNFLTLVMQDYPAWLMSNGLDPIPVIPIPVSLNRSLTNLRVFGEIRNQQIFNYSNYEIVEDFTFSDVLQGYLDFKGNIEPASALGEYEVSGDVFGTIPVSGAGLVEIEFPAVQISSSYDFVVTPDGFVDLSVATGHCSYRYSNLKLRFEELSSGDFEDDVVSLLRGAYSSNSAWLPACKHLQDYLVKMFAKTPLSEILGTTLQPPTTTTTTTTTTTPEPTCPPTTCEPCTCPEPTCPTWTTGLPCPTSTSPTCPPDSADPKFSRAIYQTSLPWPTQGFEIDLRIRANALDGSPLQYELLTTFPFVELTESRHIKFTMDISDGVYVGPNNVMVLEVLAEVVGDPSRVDSATIVIIFPKGRMVNEAEAV